LKDFAKKHPVNKSDRTRTKTSLRAKRQLNQPLKIKHFFIIAGMAVLLIFSSQFILKTDVVNLFSSQFILKTDVVNLFGGVTNPTIEFQYPIDLEKDTVLVDLQGIAIIENCEYRLQIESYGKRIYAQEQLSAMLALGLEAYVERTFSSSRPEKPLFKVMSGPYKTRSEVNNANELLRKNNRQPLIYKKCIKT